MSFPGFIARRKTKLALSLLQLNMLRNRSKPHDRIFRAAWNLSKRLHFLLADFSMIDNPRRYEVHQVVYLKLLRLLHRIKPGYVPKVTVIDEAVLADMARSTTPVIVVAIHSPVDVIVSRVFQERGIRASLLASSQRSVAEKARILACREPPDFIDVSDNALLAIRKSLRLNRIVHLCVDYKDNSSGTDRLFLSSAIFTLAAVMPLGIVFSDAQVTRDGNINLYLHAHDVSSTPGPDDIARAYLHWLKSDRGHTRDWTITATKQRGAGKPSNAFAAATPPDEAL